MVTQRTAIQVTHWKLWHLKRKKKQAENHAENTRAKRCIRVLQKHALTCRQRAFEWSSFILQQNNAKPHVVSIEKTWLCSRRVWVLNWKKKKKRMGQHSSSKSPVKWSPQFSDIRGMLHMSKCHPNVIKKNKILIFSSLTYFQCSTVKKMWVWFEISNSFFHSLYIIHSIPAFFKSKGF